jgi:membrane-bound lytic murein transglycosylase D
MGRHLLRGEDVLTRLPRALAAVLAAGAMLTAAPAPADDSPGVADGPLPPAQGTEAEEVYSFPFPDDNTIVERYVAGLLATRREWLQAAFDRGLPWRAFILAECEQRGLPRELVYLPALESGYQPRALSRVGASGLWQLMRTTAAPFGLRMDAWLDERRDPVKATEAALAKLSENYRTFRDWPLALAAYNCGAGKLSGILRKAPGLDYWQLRARGLLPRETAGFVPQFLALTRILSHPVRHGITVGWDAPPVPARLPLGSCVDLRLLARAAGVPLDALVAANPELNLPVTPPSSYGYVLKVPAEHADAVRGALDAATLPLLDVRVHVVAAGDTLSALAKRYGVTVEILLEFNPKVTPRALQVGYRLLVPVLPARRSG